MDHTHLWLDVNAKSKIQVALFELSVLRQFIPFKNMYLSIDFFFFLAEQWNKPLGFGAHSGGVEQRTDLGHHGGNLMDASAQYTAVQRGTHLLNMQTNTPILLVKYYTLPNYNNIIEMYNVNMRIWGCVYIMIFKVGQWF